MVAPFLPDEEKVAAIRAELVATAAGISLDAATAGPLPAGTDRAMREWADWELRVGRAGRDAADEFHARLDEARGTVAAILVAPAERVGLAPSLALGIRVAAERRRWRAGDRIVAAAALEAPVLATLGGLAEAVGGELDVVEAEAGEASGAAMGRLATAIGTTAALVVVPHVSPLDGTILPVAALAESTHRARAWLVVDGSLAAGAIPVDAPGLGADVYAVAGDRWLLGPSGTAALYAGPALDDGVPGSLGVPTGTSDAPPGPAGGDGLNRAAVVGLGRSAGWLAMQVGLEWAFSRTHRLVELAADSLAEVSGVHILTTADRRAAIVVFRVKGWPAERLRDELGRRVYAVVGVVEPADAIRIGLGCWNTEDELGRFCESVGELAATDPKAVRHRPPLLVLPVEPS